MQVILLERVGKLGQMGDLVTVKPGYARNFLLPQNKALRATEANKKRFETMRKDIEADSLSRKKDAEKVAGKMEGMSVILVRAASEMGQLYGSATSRDIAAAIGEQGVTIQRSQVELNTAIKTLGLFPVSIALHPEVSVEVTVNIARSEDEAEQQRKLGRAIISDIAERERLEEEEAAEREAAMKEALLDEDALKNEDNETPSTDDGDPDDDGNADDAGTAEIQSAPETAEPDAETDTPAESEAEKPKPATKKKAAKKAAPKKEAKAAPTAKTTAKAAPKKKAAASTTAKKTVKKAAKKTAKKTTAKKKK